MPVQQLREQRTSTFEKMEALMARADQEDRDLTTDERAEYDKLEATYNEAGTALAHAERRERTRREGAAAQNGLGQGRRESADPDAPPVARSIGDHFVNQAGTELAEQRGQGSRFSVSASEYSGFQNASTDVQVTDGNTGVMGPVLTQVDTTIVTGFRRELVVADLLSQGTLSGQAITYFVEGVLEGDFATVAENAQKPQLHYANPTAKTDALKKIAGYIKESDEMIEDLDFLVSAINNRLLYNLGLFEENQVLNGNGTGTNLQGLLQRSGIQALGATTDLAKNNPDQVFKAMTAVETATGLTPDGIAINPIDYQNFRLLKDNAGQYYAGGLFQGQYGNGNILERPSLWGLRTVVTPAITAGTVVVGAFKPAATLYRKGGVRVEATNSNENDFTNNRVTIRAEERVALAVRVPTAIVKLTLGTATS